MNSSPAEVIPNSESSPDQLEIHTGTDPKTTLARPLARRWIVIAAAVVHSGHHCACGDAE